VFATLAAVDGMSVRAEPGGKLIVDHGPIEGPMLLQVCVAIAAEDKRAPPGLVRWLRLRAAHEIRGDSITDICAELGVPRTTFYPRTTALALRVVAFLNAQHVDSRTVAPIP
jgi:hypothetical protein